MFKLFLDFNMFPVIYNIEDVLPHLTDEFAVRENGWFKTVVFNVQTKETFADPDEEGISDEERHHRKIRLECRGLKFDSLTGEILARPFHKFFNVNERNWTKTEKIDVKKPHVFQEKIDGSMIHPIFCPDGGIDWHTKAGHTYVSDIVLDFIEDKPEYRTFAEKILKEKKTPLFEFVSPKNRIVLDYGKENMILLAIRDNHTGEYMNYDELAVVSKAYNIPYVNVHPAKDLGTFIHKVKDMTNIEGFVITFEDGERFKMKTDEYVRMHKAVDSIRLEKNLWKMFAEDTYDDVISHLFETERKKILNFMEALGNEFTKSEQKINDIVSSVQGMTKKETALYLKENHKEWMSMVFYVYNGKGTASDILKETILRKCSSQSGIDSIRKFFGNVKYKD